MKKFFSLSSHPGKTGMHFYNGAFTMLGINASYQSIGASDLLSAVRSLLDEHGADGFSLSMPFKRSIIRYLDVPDELVIRYNTCNTVVVRDGKLFGYNCDHAGAKHVLGLVGECSSATVLGNGAMGSMISAMLGPRCLMFSRSSGNWEARHARSDLIVNATAVGTTNDGSPLEAINAEKVVDLSVNPGKLMTQCKEAGVTYISGIEFYKYQFMQQFKHYTGIDLDPLIFDVLLGKLHAAS